MSPEAPRLRVCDLTTLYLDGGQGGVNTYLLEKARYFAGRPDVSHVIVVPGRRTERRTLFASTIYTLKSPALPSNPEHRVLTQFGAVERILQDETPTVVEVDCAYLLGKVAAQALADRRVPIVGFYHVHLPTFIAKPGISRFSSRLAGAAEHWAWRYVDYCHRHCDRMVVSSRDVQARLQARGFSRLECVPLGVNLELFRPREGPRPPGPVTILHVGRLSREKDLPVLIDAFHLLAGRGDYRLEVVGDGPLRQQLEDQAREGPGAARIRFRGALPYGEALARVYAQADLLAVPSPNETFNLTVLEGLAAGLPVVAVDQGGPVDLITPEVGALARPGDPADLALKLEEVAARREELTSCRAYVERHWSWERTFSRLVEVYERALASRSSIATTA